MPYIVITFKTLLYLKCDEMLNSSFLSLIQIDFSLFGINFFTVVLTCHIDSFPVLFTGGPALGRKAKAWFIPFMDKCMGVLVKLKALTMCVISSALLRWASD